MLQRNSDRGYFASPASFDGSAAATAAKGQAIDLREIFRVLRRHARIVIFTPLVLFLISIVFVNAVTPLYTATTTVFIDPRRASVADLGNQVVTNVTTDDSTIESQVLLIQSIAVLERVVEKLKLNEDPEFVPESILAAAKAAPESNRSASPDPATGAKAKALENLQKRLKVVRQAATFLVDIRASSRDPAKAAAIANAVADSYFEEQVLAKQGATKIAADWFGRQLDELKARVLASDKAVEDFRAANNLIAAQGVTINDQQMTDLNNKLVEARVVAAEARAKYEQAQAVAQRGDPGAVTEALSSEVIARLRTQYAELAKNEAELSSRLGAQHPLLIKVRAQLAETRQLINEEIKRILEGRRHSYEVAAAREAALQQSLNDLQGVSSQSGQAQVRLRELEREVEANRALYESFLARHKQASAQESLALPESRIVTRAAAPLEPSFPRVPLTLALALVIGLGLGCVLALLADYLDRRVKTLEQAARRSGLPALASIPLISLRELARLAKRGRGELEKYDPKTARLLPPALQPPIMRYAIEHPTSIFAEAVRAVRFAVQRARKNQAAQVVMVTSAIDGEGKTTLAVNLALSLAASGVRTILVEGDLRNPELSRSLAPRAQSGLLAAATGEIPLHQAILVEQTTRLAILPSPPPADSALAPEFVSSDKMAGIINELRQHFEIVIVDAPPVLPVIDGRALAESADRIILTVGWDRTPESIFMRAVERLSPFADRILGIALTLVDLHRQRFYEADDAAYDALYMYGEQPSHEHAGITAAR